MIASSYAKTELLKWVALLLMLGDHINKYLFNGTNDLLFNAGRLCLPVFVFVLAQNLSKSKEGAHRRTISRLFLFGVIACIPYSLLGSSLPLNILFTLLVIVLTVYLSEQKTNLGYSLSVFVFVFGGYFVEFWWPAVSLGVALFYHIKYSSRMSGVIAALALMSLYYINGNHYALLALPLVMLTPNINKFPRLRWAFYVFYPLHLLTLLLIRIPMGKAGYLFF